MNGVCLTATTYDKDSFVADAMAETVDKTNLGKLAPGHKVNLERALSLKDRLGGHLVTGHVDGVGIIKNVKRYDIAILITVEAPENVMRYIIKKGSVTLDGTSLTVVDYTSESFQVSLIPHTAHHTVLGRKGNGDIVNLEADILGKYMEKLLLQRDNTKEKDQEKSNLTKDFLSQYGFA